MVRALHRTYVTLAFKVKFDPVIVSMSIHLSKPFKMIAAVNRLGGIGCSGLIPWHIPEDMRYFKQVTTGNPDELINGGINAVIMGRKTWDSLPAKHRPLKDRINVVLSQTKSIHTEGAMVFNNIHEALNWMDDNPLVRDKWVIGGSSLYKQLIGKNWCSELHLTRIEDDTACDAFFPEVPDYYKERDTHILGSQASVTVYRNRYTAHLEQQYINQMRKLVTYPLIGSRNSQVHSKWKWDYSMDLQDGLPLFSTRRAFWRGIATELLFFIHGSTDANLLADKDIHIWDGNTTREFLDQRGLVYRHGAKAGEPYVEGDMGPMYGWVWRNWGARYRGCKIITSDTDIPDKEDEDEKEEGEVIDQLWTVLDKLLHNPQDRRIIMTDYNPTLIPQSVLAPCHSIHNHFKVRQEKDGTYLDMTTYQRSADMFLGVNFNIPSDALLQTIIAKAVGMKPGIMHVRFGDSHVYESHREAVLEQYSRTPADTFPTLEITSKRDIPTDSGTQQALDWIESLTYEDFKVVGYKPQKGIKADMVA